MKDRFLVWCWKHTRGLGFLFAWVVICLAIFVYHGSPLVFVKADKSKLMPNILMDGHYQIEESCSACHKPFQGVRQEVCADCHAQELKEVNDSHAVKKFRDPRNAIKLEKINALECKTCHDDHKPNITGAMGVTVEPIFCIHCHDNIADERASHKGFDFKKCRQCHNYHDNTALYENFVQKHLDEPKNLEKISGLERNFKTVYPEIMNRLSTPLTIEKQNGPENSDKKLIKNWVESTHAQSGVNCRDCHETEDQGWNNKPENRNCAKCHSMEMKGFLKSRHGMRLNQKNLSPMKPGMARASMKAEASEKELTCNSCHGAHQFDTRSAEIESCLECHNDKHSIAFKKSAHFKLWNLKEGTKKGRVSCANCHFPRKKIRTRGINRVLIDHNQNNNLRPNQKMIRSVCMNCHGFKFSLNALSDQGLIENNFMGKPKKISKIPEMVARELRKKGAIK